MTDPTTTESTTTDSPISGGSAEPAHELTPTVIASLIAIGVLTVAPLYLFTGSPEPYYLGVPWWGWLLLTSYYVILALVVLMTRSLKIVETAEATDGVAE